MSTGVERARGLERSDGSAAHPRLDGRARALAPAHGLRPGLIARGEAMAFYPTPFGHAEVRVDRRDPRPPRYSETLLRIKRRRSK